MNEKISTETAQINFIFNIFDVKKTGMESYFVKVINYRYKLLTLKSNSLQLQLLKK